MMFFSRFGVRPLPKKQMVLKLKEIHQYTHQLQSSESEEETSGPQRPQNASNSQSAPLSFKQPTAPPAVSPMKLPPSEEDELLSASQNSNTSSTAESERYSSYMAIDTINTTKKLRSTLFFYPGRTQNYVCLKTMTQTARASQLLRLLCVRRTNSSQFVSSSYPTQNCTDACCSTSLSPWRSCGPA